MAKRRTFSAYPVSTSAATMDVLKRTSRPELAWNAPRGTGPGWNSPETPIEITRSEMILSPGDIMFRVGNIPGLAARLLKLSKSGEIQKVVPSFRIEGGTAVVRGLEEKKAFMKALRNLGTPQRGIDRINRERQGVKKSGHLVYEAVRDAVSSAFLHTSPLTMGRRPAVSIKPYEVGPRSRSAARGWFVEEELKRDAELDLYKRFLDDLYKRAPQRFFREIDNDPYLMKLAKKWKMVE